MLSLERIWKDQQESHQQQLASFLAIKAALREENVTLRDAATAPRHGNSKAPRNLARSESTDNFSPPPRRDHPHVSNPRLIRTPSPRRNLDPALSALDYMSSFLFVQAILNQEARPHFALPKFEMYDALQDPFDHLMHCRQIMTLQTHNDTQLCKVFPSNLAGPALSWFHWLPPNKVTSFHDLSEKFVTQYMCSVRRKHNVTSLFHT